MGAIDDWGYKFVNPQAFHDKGYKGRAVHFVIDTMDVSDHPDVEPKLLKEFCKSFIAEPAGDGNGHGTWVASRIAGLQDGVGVRGIAPNSPIVGVKALNKSGAGTDIALEQAIMYVADVQLPPQFNNWPRIINMSLGASVPMPRVEEALKYAVSKGVIVVAAAGNSGYNGSNSINYPARYEDLAIAVGAFDSNVNPAPFSSGGPEIDFAAPGVGLYGAWLNKGYASLNGTCLSGDTYVSTTDGPVKIKDVEIGMRVYSYDEIGNKCVVRTVVDHLNNGTQQTYKVKLTGSEISATSNHPFLTVSDDGNSLVWKELSDLSVSDVVLVPKKIPDYNGKFKDYLDSELRALFNETEYKRKPIKPILITEELCQLIGAWLGDGHLIYDGRGAREYTGLSIAIKNGYKQLNEDLPQLYKELAEKATGLEWVIDKGCIRTYSNYILDVFALLDVKGDVYSKEVPSFVYKLPETYKKAFIAGIIDSDGTIGKTWGDLNLEISNSKLLNGVKDLFQHLGKRTSNISTRTRVGTEIHGRVLVDVKPSYTLKVNGIHDLNLPVLDSHYKTFLDNRVGKPTKKGCAFKQSRNKFCLDIVENSDFTFDKIKSIELDKEEIVYDLTIEGTHNFIANGIVVHNSMATPAIAGIIDLLIQRYNLPLNQKAIEQALKQYAKDIFTPGFDVRTGDGTFILSDVDTPPPPQTEQFVELILPFYNGWPLLMANNGEITVTLPFKDTDNLESLWANTMSLIRSFTSRNTEEPIKILALKIKGATFAKSVSVNTGRYKITV